MSDIEYKRVSGLSVVALVSSIVAVAAFMVPVLLVFAIAALLIAAVSIRNIHRHTLSGLTLNVASICLAGPTLLLAPVWHFYLFRSESLPGHIRVDFAGAKIDKTTSLDDYANKAICLKGYVLPTTENVLKGAFHLSPDGDDTKPGNSIRVKLPSQWEYQYAPVAVSGVLTVNPHATDPAQRYVLAAKAIHLSSTSYNLVPRVPGGGFGGTGGTPANEVNGVW